jgi:hypothetical protein
MHCYVLTTIDTLPHCLALDGCLFYKKTGCMQNEYNQSLQPNKLLAWKRGINIEVPVK